MVIMGPSRKIIKRGVAVGFLSGLAAFGISEIYSQKTIETAPHYNAAVASCRTELGQVATARVTAVPQECERFKERFSYDSVSSEYSLPSAKTFSRMFSTRTEAARNNGIEADALDWALVASTTGLIMGGIGEFYLRNRDQDIVEEQAITELVRSSNG